MDLALWRQTKKQRGMTYQDISDSSGIPLGTIKNIFAGYTPDPRESTINAIEKALGVETRIIRADMELNAEEQLLLNDFRALSRSDKAQASEYVRYLAQKKRKNS